MAKSKKKPAPKKSAKKAAPKKNPLDGGTVAVHTTISELEKLVAKETAATPKDNHPPVRHGRGNCEKVVDGKVCGRELYAADSGCASKCPIHD